MTDGDRLRDEGMKRVDDRALPPWKAMADKAILDLARSGREFNAEDVTAVAGMPAQPNAIGARMSAAARQGIIEPVAYKKATRASRHSSRSLTWKGTAKAGSYLPPIPLVKPTRTAAAPKPPTDKPWRCTTCNTAYEDKYVQASLLSPDFGEVYCSTCLRKKTAKRTS